MEIVLLKRFWIWGVALSLGGMCLTGTSFAKNSDEKAIDDFKAQVKSQTWLQTKPDSSEDTGLQFNTTFPDKAWWTQFNDTYLTQYIQQALTANHTLKSAQHAIEQARAVVREYRGQEFPQVSLAPQFTRERLLFNSFGVGSLGGAATGTTFSYYTLPISVNYEADVFLKNHDVTRSYKALAEASLQNARATQITLCTDVATAYFNLLYAKLLISDQEQLIAFQTKDLENQQKQYAVGLVAQDIVDLSNETLQSSQTTLQSYRQAKATASSQLAILIGKTPESLPDPPSGTLKDITNVTTLAAGYPADLIARRPDILSAENTLASDKLDVRIARKQLLPTFNLLGDAGFGAVDIGNLINWQNRLWELAATMTQTLFSGGTRKATIQAAKAQYKGQIEIYEQTILQALKEVEDSAASLKADHAKLVHNQAILSSMDARAVIENNRYQQGVLAFPDLNTTLEQELTASQTVGQSKTATLVDTLSLYKALGGGF